MDGDCLKVGYWPEMSMKGRAENVSDSLSWDNLLDYNEVDIEEDFLQQHIALLMVPSMQHSSLQALSVSDNDLLILTGIGLWEPLRQGLRCCLAGKNKQVMTGATSLITKLHAELSKVHDYTCIGQLFCLIAQAIEQAASVQQCEAIWVSCLPILTAVANHLPHTCMHITEAELADTVETCCALLRVCMKSPSYLLQQSLNGDGSMKWWHSWLARVSIGKVLSGCLIGTQLLEEALSMVLRAAKGELSASQGGVLLAMHVVAGLLSLAKVRQLFPLDMSRQGLAQVSVEGAIQALIAIQQSSHPSLPNTTMPPNLATPKGRANIKPAVQPAATVSDVRAAAFYGLQSLALLQSSRGVHIFGPVSAQQLLQSSLVFLPEQQKERSSGKCSSASQKGKAGAVQGQKRVAMGKAAGSAAVKSSIMTQDVHLQQWSLVRDAWDIISRLCDTSAGCEVVIQARVHHRQVLQSDQSAYPPASTVQREFLSAADLAAILLRCILSKFSPNTAHQIDAATAAIMMATLTPIVSAVQALAQTSAGYETADVAGIGDMMIQHLSHTSSSNTNPCAELITEGVLGLCTQPLFSLRLSRSSAALSICASRLASKAQHEEPSSWLHQASALALTRAGQRALLHAGLPQQLLCQLYQLPMQDDDCDTDAMREQRHAQCLHACEVVMSWHAFAEHLLPAGADLQPDPSHHTMLESLCRAALQASPCPLSSLADCPALPSLQGTETALRLLTAACLPLRCRWVVNNHLCLGRRLQQQSESQAKEAGADVIDITTARRQHLLGMLQAAQEPADTTLASASQQYRHSRSGSVTSSAQGQQSPSLSELSVSDPGMKNPQEWWLSVQQALMEGIKQGQVQWRALPLILQRTVMVAMKALCQGGLPPAAPAHLALRPEGDQRRTPLSAAGVLNSPYQADAGAEQAMQCIMVASSQSEVQAFVAQGRQQLPSLAKDLTALKLQDFLCTIHRLQHPVTPSTGGAPVVQAMDCFASIVWLVMRGDAVASEFLAALTASQAAVYLWPAWGQGNAEQGPQLMLTHCLSMMLTEELPLLHGLLMQSGLHVGHLVSLWHEQCFLGILELPNVVLYVTMGVLLGPEWQLYFMLAVLQQQEGRLRQQWLQQGMLCEAFTGQLDFDIQKALPVMEELQDRWSEKIKTILVQPPSSYI